MRDFVLSSVLLGVAVTVCVFTPKDPEGGIIIKANDLRVPSDTFIPPASYMPRGYNGKNGDSIIKSMPARMDSVRARGKQQMIERMK